MLFSTVSYTIITLFRKKKIKGKKRGGGGGMAGGWQLLHQEPGIWHRNF